jgi:hypothetical protein
VENDFDAGVTHKPTPRHIVSMERNARGLVVSYHASTAPLPHQLPSSSLHAIFEHRASKTTVSRKTDRCIRAAHVHVHALNESQSISQPTCNKSRLDWKGLDYAFYSLALTASRILAARGSLPRPIPRAGFPNTISLFGETRPRRTHDDQVTLK